MKLAPLYNLRGWSISDGSDRVIRLRPGARTFLLRLRWLAVWLILAAAIHYGAPRLYRPSSHVEPPPPEIAAQKAALEEEFSEYLGEETIQRIHREHEASVAAKQRELDRMREFAIQVDKIRVGVVAALAGFGLLIPLGCLWNRINIYVDPFGNLNLRTLFWITRKRTWPLAEFRAIQIAAHERIHRGRRGRVLDHGWEWVIFFDRPGQPDAPIPLDIGFTSEPVGPQFTVDRQKDHPGPMKTPPPNVTQFARLLSALTRLPLAEIRLFEIQNLARRGHTIRQIE